MCVCVSAVWALGVNGRGLLATKLNKKTAFMVRKGGPWSPGRGGSCLTGTWRRFRGQLGGRKLFEGNCHVNGVGKVWRGRNHC